MPRRPATATLRRRRQRLRWHAALRGTQDLLLKRGMAGLLLVCLLAQLACFAAGLHANAQGEPVLGWAIAGMAPGLLAAILGLLVLIQGRHQVQRAYDQLEEAIDALPASVEIFDAQDRLVAYNRKLIELYPHMWGAFDRGASFSEMARASVYGGGVPEARGREEAWLAERLAQRGRQQEPLLQRVHDNKWLRIYEQRTASGGIVGVRLDVSDLVREQQRLAGSQAHLQAVIQAARNAIITLDTDGHMLEVNPACEVLFGYTSAELQGAHLSLVLDGGEHGESRLQPQLLLGRQHELSGRHRGGSVLALQLNVAEVKTATTHLFVCIIADFTERKRQELRLRRANELLARQSTTDGLTGVGNRRLFDELLRQAWQRSRQRQQPLSLLLIDIDHFKQYNDCHGHVAGDDCLRRVASLLQSCVNEAALCRYGGEEFAVLLEEVDAAEARRVAQRCLDSLRLAAIPHGASPSRGGVSISIGHATWVAQPGEDAAVLVERADAALYAAKRDGRARLVGGDSRCA